MKLRWFGIVSLIGIFTISCSDEKGTIGSSIRPDGEGITVSADRFQVQSSSFNPVSIPTGVDDSYNMLGVYADPVFGTTTASFLTQLSLAQPVDFGSNVEVDSVKLNLLFGGWYGDSLSLSELEVYQLNNASGLSSYDSHQSNENPLDYTTTDASNFLGSLKYTAVNLSIPDSTRFSPSYFPTLTVNLDKRVGEYFVDNQANGMFDSNDNLRSFFQGIYVKPTIGQKTIMKCQVQKYDASGNIYNTNMIIYYNNDDVLYENDTLTYKVSVADSISDTLFYDMDYNGVNDLCIIKPAGGSDWYSKLLNGTTGALYPGTGSDVYNGITASEFRSGVFDSTFQLNNTSNSADQIFWIKTGSKRWLKAMIMNIDSDSLGFQRVIYSGQQSFGFISARGNAAINFVENVPPTSIQYDSTTAIAVKGMGMMHSLIYFPSGSDINQDTSNSKALINRGQISFQANDAYAHKSEIPRALLLSSLNGTDLIPGMNFSGIIGMYVDSTNSYTFDVSGFTQYLINNPATVAEPLELKVYNEIGDPSGLLLNKPDSAIQIIHTAF